MARLRAGAYADVVGLLTSCVWVWSRTRTVVAPVSQWLRVRVHAMIGAATRRVQSAARSRSRARSRRTAHRRVTRWREPASPSSRLQTWHYNRTSRLQTCSIQTTLFGYPMAFLRRPPRARGERPFCLMRVSSEHERARLS